MRLALSCHDLASHAIEQTTSCLRVGRVRADGDIRHEKVGCLAQKGVADGVSVERVEDGGDLWWPDKAPGSGIGEPVTIGGQLDGPGRARSARRSGG